MSFTKRNWGTSSIHCSNNHHCTNRELCYLCSTLIETECPNYIIYLSVKSFYIWARQSSFLHLPQIATCLSFPLGTVVEQCCCTNTKYYTLPTFMTETWILRKGVCSNGWINDFPIILQKIRSEQNMYLVDSLRPFYANLMMHNDPCLKAFLRIRVEIMKVVFWLKKYSLSVEIIKNQIFLLIKARSFLWCQFSHSLMIDFLTKCN